MPRRDDIAKALILGSGSIIIGQAYITTTAATVAAAEGIAACSPEGKDKVRTPQE